MVTFAISFWLKTVQRRIRVLSLFTVKNTSSTFKTVNLEILQNKFYKKRIIPTFIKNPPQYKSDYLVRSLSKLLLSHLSCKFDNLLY